MKKMKHSWPLLVGILLFSLTCTGIAVMAHEPAEALKPNKLVTVYANKTEDSSICVMKMTEPEGYLILTYSNAGATQSFVRGWDDVDNANRRVRHKKAFGCTQPGCKVLHKNQ